MECKFFDQKREKTGSAALAALVPPEINTAFATPVMSDNFAETIVQEVENQDRGGSSFYTSFSNISIYLYTILKLSISKYWQDSMEWQGFKTLEKRHSVSYAL